MCVCTRKLSGQQEPTKLDERLEKNKTRTENNTILLYQ